MVRWKLNFISACLGSRQSPSRINCTSQRRLDGIFSLDIWPASSYAVCNSEHVLLSSPSRTKSDPSFWCEQALMQISITSANREFRFSGIKTDPSSAVTIEHQFCLMALQCQPLVYLLSRQNYQSNFFEHLHSPFSARQLGSTLNISIGKHKCIPRKISNKCISTIVRLECIEDRNIRIENLPTINPCWA